MKKTHNKKNSVASSLLYKFFERLGIKGIGFVISVILARLLDPEIFGLVAIIIAVNSIAQTFVDSGLSTALVQNKSANDADYSTVFYISFGISAFLYVILFFCAPLIATYYELDGLVMPFRVLSLTLLFYSYNSIQVAKLTREMQFSKMFACNMTVTVLTGTIGVVMAYKGFGLWSLVFYYLSNSILSCVAYMIVEKWRPKLVFSVSRAKELFNYGYKILISGLLCSIFSNIRTFIIGKMYSPTDLGYYNRGEQIPSIVSTTMDSVFSSVMLPVYARAQGNKQRVCSMLSRTVSLNSFINFTAMFGLAAVAAPLVQLLYTEKWMFCVPYLQILSLANLTVSIFSPCLVTIKAVGRSDIYLKLEVVRRIVMVGILLLSLCFHLLIAIAIGWLISTIVDVAIILVPIKKLVGYSWCDQFRDVLPSLLISIVMCGIVYCVSLFNLPTVVILILQLFVGMGVYLGIAWLFRVKNLTYLLSKFKSYLAQKG